MSARRTLLLGLVVACAAGDARAYETICSPTDPGSLEAGIRVIVCSAPDQPRCAPGPGSARGHLLGEHVALAFEALERAGLGVFNAEPLTIRTWSDGAPVPESAGEPRPLGASVAPTGAAAMTAAVERRHWLAEFAEVTDLSYSLSDWALGNEHCLAPDALVAEAVGTPEGIAACHTFGSHMGSVNSTHFNPQTRALYELYHGLALAHAGRCAATADAFAAAPAHPAAETMERAVRACEEEALVLESVASHYLGDAWSTGHMWERWGSPVFAPTAVGRFQAQIVALLSGVIHGWRSIARSYFSLVNLGDLSLQHDRMCMPGRFDPTDATEPVVQWRYAPEALDDGLHEGGGDLYLYACNAIAQDPRRAVETGTTLRFQYDRMLTCLALGFAEVYAAGPQTRGPLAPAGALDPAVTGPLDPLCWEQRVTNRSLALGFGVNSWDAAGDPRVLSRVVAEVLPLAADFSSQTGVGLLEYEAVKIQARYELVRAGERFVRSADVNPDGATMAQRPNPTVRADGQVTGALLGLLRNSEYVPLIAQDQVPYLERRDHDAWSARPAGAAGCAADADCGPGAVCDRGSVSDGGDTTTRRCVRHEAAVLRAFRDGELAAWCTETRDVDLAAAGARCAADGGAACDACVALAEPLVRRACDAVSFSQYRLLRTQQGTYGGENDALCDLLADANVTRPQAMALQVRPEPGGPALAARAACQRPGALPSRATVAVPTYDMDEAPPAAAEPLAIGVERDRFTCGATVGERWRRFAAPAADAGRALAFRLTTKDIALVSGPPHRQDALGLSLDLYDGCAPGGGATARSTPFDEDGAPGSEGREVRWTVPAGGGEVCVRVTAEGDSVWASYDLEVRDAQGPPPGGGEIVQITAGYAHVCALRADGRVSCIGRNLSGQIGDGTTEDRFELTDVRDVAGATAVSAAANHTCAIVDGGFVTCWGFNGTGNLGTGSSSAWETARVVSGVSGATALSHAVNEHICAAHAGVVSCWGGPNGIGQLGDGMTGTGPGPVLALVSGGPIASGQFHGCAAGPVCWGNNHEGALGDGTQDDSLAPVGVIGAGGAAAIVAGNAVSCALSGGAVLCWGADFNGFAGDRLTATPVPGAAGGVQLGHGGSHGCIRTAAGQVQCWGYNFYGQLGDQLPQVDRDDARTVEGIDDAVDLAVGAEFTAVLRADGCIWYWGRLNYASFPNGAPVQLVPRVLACPA